MKWIEGSLKYGVTVAVGVTLIILFGTLSLFRIPVQLVPDVSQPELTITTEWPGASPEEVERDIIDEQEKHLKSLVGLVEMKSLSQTGRGQVYLSFQTGADLQEILVRTSNALQQVSSYPEDVDQPVIKTVNVSDRPIAWFVLQPLPGMEDKVNVYQYRDFAEDKIQSRFERVPGVSDSEVRGGSRLEVHVTFNPDALAERGLSVFALREALRRQNHNVSGGDFDEGKRRYIIRTQGEFRSIEDIKNTILAQVNGRAIYTKDVAEVTVDYDELRDYVRHNGLAGIAINARRELGSNILTVMKELKKVQADLNENLLHPLGMHLVQTADTTEYITRSIDMVQINLVVGGIFATLILLLFLRSLYSTLVIAIAIPISVIGAFLVITVMGRTINVIMLAGMAFAVGMVVDASIIVLENIYSHKQMGKPTRQAAVEGASEVWGAILATTLTTLVVFIPILFIEEEAGQLFRDIAVAISAAVCGKLPVEPAMITGPAGGRSIQVPASRRIRSARRRAGSTAPAASRCAGQCSPMMARNLSVACQCSAKRSGTTRASRPNGTSWICSSSSRPASEAARRAAWSMPSPSAPRAAPSAWRKRCTRRASRICRSRSGTAGGRAVSSSGRPESRAESISSSSTSPIGRIAGSSMACPSPSRRKASLSAVMARWFGSRTVAADSASGSPPLSSTSRISGWASI